jgi:putative ABC transport system permease protein
MSAILGVLGVIILLLSGLLVINTISAMLSQQVRQIGMMKAVGAQNYQIFILYEVSMLFIGLLALAIAVPLGQLGTRLTVGIITGIINFDFINFNTPASVLLIQLALSVLVPMLVAMVPILSGARVTVHEAINDYGISNTQFGESVIDKALGYVRGLPRPLLLSLRNTFRRKMRLSLTLISLTLGSAIFIAVLSVYAGLMSTLDEALDYYRFDILVSFSRPYRIEQVEAELSRVPGIVTSETWGVTSTRIKNEDGSETDTIILVAPPADTELINPKVIEGRWLIPGDEDAIVINSDVLAEKPDISIGDEITLNIEGSEKNWRVVGIVRSVMSGPQAYTNYNYFTRVTGGYGEAGAVYLATERHDPLYQIEMAKELEDYFGRVGINVASTSLVAELRATAVSQFNVIFVFLLMMAILLTIVGGFGLTGTMSLNVLERTREIGVMRAIGASNGAVMQIVIVEGVLIGLISWIFGIILAYPLGWMLSDIVGMGFLRTSISYTYSTTGAIVWLFVVILLAIVASILPARSATSVPVRDVLAYE